MDWTNGLTYIGGRRAAVAQLRQGPPRDPRPRDSDTLSGAWSRECIRYRVKAAAPAQPTLHLALDAFLSSPRQPQVGDRTGAQVAEEELAVVLEAAWGGRRTVHPEPHPGRRLLLAVLVRQGQLPGPHPARQHEAPSRTGRRTRALPRAAIERQ